MPHISTVSYQKTFNLGMYQSERIHVELTLNEGENATEALDTARNLVEEYHRKTTPVEPYEMMCTKVVDIQKDKPLSTRDAVINGIQTCTEVKVLESYKLLCGVDTELKHIYETKLKELTNE